MEPYGVIDLGTNTFHLLIAGLDEREQLREIFRERRFVKLAEEGIETIGRTPFQRGMQALCDYHRLLDRYQVVHIRAIGTAALRTAANGAAFIRQVREKTGIAVELISGDEEARLIYLGVQQALPAAGEQLIVDIGGGSVEFIIAGPDGVRWARSFPIGVAVLYRQFHHRDPMPEEEIRLIRAFLQEQLAPLGAALRRFPVEMVVGAAGTFEVLAERLTTHRPTPAAARLDLAAFSGLHDHIIGSTQAERLASDFIPPERVDLIVVSLVLIGFILETARAPELMVSNYAMKEGILYEMIGSRR